MCWFGLNGGNSAPPSLEHPKHARPTDPEPRRDLLGPNTLAAQLDHLGCLALRRRNPPTIFAFGFGLCHSLPLALQHDLALKLSEGPHKIQHELACRRRGVE